MRIIIMSNIEAVGGSSSKAMGNRAFEQGGYRTAEEQKEYIEIWKRLGYEAVSYKKDLVIGNEDVILFGDREHFYEGWKFLKKNKLLKNTICVMIESPVVDRKCGKKVLTQIRNAFPVIMIYQDDMVDGHKFFKEWPSIRITSEMHKSKVPWEEKGLAVIVCTNQLHTEETGELYSERKRIIEYFEKNSKYEFGLFGRGWEGYSNWGGCINSKTEIYDKYKFSICLENARINGYITEKIFDCLIKGIIPVYGGAYNVTSYIPQNCFIDYFQFDSIDEMVGYLVGMDEDTYNGYLDNIKKFLESEESLQFGMQRSVERTYEVIQCLPSKFSVGILEWINMMYYVKYRGSIREIFREAYVALYGKISKNKILIGILRKIKKLYSNKKE